jgi:hypothetical protein
MRSTSRIAVSAAVAALMLIAVSATSSAAWFSIVGETFRAAWPELRFTGAGSTVTCAVTLEGSFAQGTFSATAGTRVGSVARASVGACRGGSATILSATLPWSLQYASFGGTLPNITSLTFHLVGAAFQVRPEGLVACLARTTAERPVVGIAQRESLGALTAFEAEETAGIRLEGFLCEFAGEGHVGGRAGLTQEGRTEAVEMFLEEQGIFLVADGEHKLNDVPIAGTETRTLIVGVEKNDTIILNEIESANNAKFRVVAGGARCEERTVLSPRLASRCQFNIQRQAGVPARESVRIIIRYEQRGIFWNSRFVQEFNVIAT